MDKRLKFEISDIYRIGQVVVSKRGKDVGSVYVIVGFSDDGRLALADAKKFNVSCPKVKNPKHVQLTSRCITEIAGSVASGKDINHGYLCRFLSELNKDALVD